MREADWTVLEAAKGRLSDDGGRAVAAAAQSPLLQGIILRMLDEWPLAFGVRDLHLHIEYQDHRPVLVKILDNRVIEEKIR